MFKTFTNYGKWKIKKQVHIATYVCIAIATLVRSNVIMIKVTANMMTNTMRNNVTYILNNCDCMAYKILSLDRMS